MANETPDYALLARQVAALVEDQPHWMSSLANVSALLATSLPHINWVGFYIRDSRLGEDSPASELVLGPFQGKVACTRIPFGRGVCGTAAQLDRTQRVDDVQAFAGHIACDTASASELVVPLHASGQVVGVLDIDSPQPARFSAADQTGLERVARAVERVFCA